MSPFGLQISRSKANIQAFNSTAAKLRDCEQNTIYNVPISRVQNRGYLTQDLDETTVRLPNTRSECRIQQTLRQKVKNNRMSKAYIAQRKKSESRQLQSKAGKGFSFAKMVPRDDSMYKVSAIQFLKKTER